MIDHKWDMLKLAVLQDIKSYYRLRDRAKDFTQALSYGTGASALEEVLQYMKNLERYDHL